MFLDLIYTGHFKPEYTGHFHQNLHQYSSGGSTLAFRGALTSVKPNLDFNAGNADIIGLFHYDVSAKLVGLYGLGIKCNFVNWHSINLQTWTKLIYYIDFDNQKIHEVVPSLNFSYECALVENKNEIKTLLLSGSNWIGSQATTPTYKYDNIVISAVNMVPLSTQDFLSEKFSVFPNPATDIVNVSNNDNIDIKGVNIYDVSGKLVKSNFYTNETNVQMNISTFASGLYVFSIKTENGTIIKNVIKN